MPVDGRSSGPGLCEEAVSRECSAPGDPILAEGEPSLLVAGEAILWVGELTADSFLEGDRDAKLQAGRHCTGKGYLTG